MAEGELGCPQHGKIESSIIRTMSIGLEADLIHIVADLLIRVPVPVLERFIWCGAGAQQAGTQAAAKDSSPEAPAGWTRILVADFHKRASHSSRRSISLK